MYCANAIGGSVSIDDVLENFKGKEFLAFLEFSFEGSFSKLTNDEIQVLLFLAFGYGSYKKEYTCHCARRRKT